jgi:Tfp pilus assembly protein PilF
LAEAVESYRRAVTINPSHVEAHSNLGNALKEQRKLDQAIASYKKALSLNPTYVEAHNNLGVALKEQGRLDDAVVSYERALSLKPNHAEAHCNLGIALKEQGKLEAAIASFERALALKPDYVKAHHNLGLSFLWQQQFDRAMTSLRRSADLQHNHGRPANGTSVHKSRIKHDAEQIQHLLDRGVLARDHATYLDSLNRLRQQCAHDAGPTTRLTIGHAELQQIASSFNRILHYAESPALPQGALNQCLDVEAIEARYHASRPEIMYIDDLLNAEALQSLRRFCLESTIWKKDYENGYIGAFLAEGFSSPLLLQIAEELRVRFPGIFKQHLLTQAWAFKYDSELTGLNIHADAAAVNVNFWITADDANLDPSRGGLVVWDKEAPEEWDFKEYNNKRNEPKIREFLRSRGANAMTIPYRQNRAVVFNSDLFHETDQLTFKDEYANRRINVTLLYGYRFAS